MTESDRMKGAEGPRKILSPRPNDTESKNNAGHGSGKNSREQSGFGGGLW